MTRIRLTVGKSTANAVGSNTIDFFLLCKTRKAWFLAEEEAFEIGMLYYQKLHWQTLIFEGFVSSHQLTINQHLLKGDNSPHGYTGLVLAHDLIKFKFAGRARYT